MSLITNAILSGAMLFGYSASHEDYPKEINEDTYNIVPMYVHEVKWSDDGGKQNSLSPYDGNSGSETNFRYLTEYFENKNNSNLDNTNNSNNRDKDKTLLSSYDMEYLDDLYKQAGYKKYTLRFPVGKNEPYKNSLIDFSSTFPFDDAEDVHIYGYASPDGKKPEMQEHLSKKRMDKAIYYLNNNKLTAKLFDSFLCSKEIKRNLCWKADIYYKLKKNNKE